jgi:uncharacterized protein RhaS with RHS repeats
MMRRLNPDPISFEDELNLYAYVSNNPLYYSDPDGRLLFLLPLINITWGATLAAVSFTTIEIVAVAAHKIKTRSWMRSIFGVR